MITLGVPVIDRHEHTKALIESLARTVRGPFHLIIFDNASAEPYIQAKYYDAPFPIRVLRYEENKGYYQPLRHLIPKALPGLTDLFGLVHNDVIFYEEGWDHRVQQAFAADPRLGLVGLCGSWKIDELGGRGDGTMCFFRGERGQSQDAGARITDLRPSLVLDSLFMCFRRDALMALNPERWEDLPLAHFYDKIWPCRLIERGFRVAVLGSEIDHLGGVTVADFDRFEADAKRWCLAQGLRAAVGDLPNGQTGECYGLAMYLEAERRFLSEYRDRKGFLPCWIDSEYKIHRGDISLSA